MTARTLLVHRALPAPGGGAGDAMGATQDTMSVEPANARAAIAFFVTSTMLVFCKVRREVAQLKKCGSIMLLAFRFVTKGSFSL